MINFYIFLIVFFGIIVSIVINFTEQKYEIDLLSNNDISKLLKYRVERLELKRFVKTTYLGNIARVSPSIVRRKEISINAAEQNKIGMYNTNEDELEVIAYVGSYSHRVFTCPFSLNNKIHLLNVVNHFNAMR